MGWPTVFIRLTGCPLRCVYCDTTYAFSGGEKKSIRDILTEVKRHATRYVTVTGGEPLAQKSCLRLLECLADGGYEVSLETSGALDVAEVDPRVVKVLDLKTPASGECHRNLYENLRHLRPQDQVKFVIAGEKDYRWAVQQLEEWQLPSRCEVLFSPVSGRQSATELADWIIRDQLPVRFQVQLHRILWGDSPGK